MVFSTLLFNASGWRLHGEPIHRAKHRHHKRHADDTANNTTDTKNDNPSNKHVVYRTITDVENLFVCIQKDCYQVKEFNLEPTFNPSCYKDDLEIKFEIAMIDPKDPSKKTTTSSGFLNHKKDRGSFISKKESERSETCQLIKR